MNTAELQAVPGVPESGLDDATAASLPAEAPPAPWNCACDSIVWLSRGGPAAASALAATIEHRGPALGVVGGMVSYRDTPVGAYREVFGAVGVLQGRRPRGTIPFMAVDSRASLVGGRSNWALPKSLARFTGEPSAATTMTAEGDGWTVRVTAKAIGPDLPLRMAGRIVQRWPDHVVRTAGLRGRARSRPALVTVEVVSDGSLADWLRPGRHLGAILTGATFMLPTPGLSA